MKKEELAEEVLHDAFLKIWDKIGEYSSQKGKLFTWMLNIARNLTIDTLRSKSYKKQVKIQGYENSVDNFSDNSSGTSQFDSLGIRSQLTRLKNDQKQIIDLAYFAGFTQEEIAKQLSIPLGTVKTRMRTAIMELRKLLQV